MATANLLLFAGIFAAQIFVGWSIGCQSDAVFAKATEILASVPKSEIKAINTVILFVILQNGKIREFWTADLVAGRIYKGPPKTKYQVTITIEDSDLVQIATGKMNPITAYTQRKLMVTGNLAKAAQLVVLFKGYVTAHPNILSITPVKVAPAPVKATTKKVG